MKLHRDDCCSALCRADGWSCVFGRIVSVEPLELEDTAGRLCLDNVQEDAFVGSAQNGDYCYVLLDASVRPIQCIRVTVVPAEIAPLAQYQLMISRHREAQLQQSG